MKLPRCVTARLAKTEWGRRLLGERRFRMVLAAAAGFCCNLLFALYHGVLGVLTLSLWLLTMCAYYMVLAAARFSAVLCEHKGGSNDTEYFVMELSGALMILLSVVLAGANYLSLSRSIATKYDEIIMITLAAYTFYKITMTTIRAVRQRKDSAPLPAVIRKIGCAEAAASVLTLQRSMLASFGSMDNGEAHMMNLLTGAAVCLFVLLLGGFMTVQGIRKR